jgi:hypothetical protein
MNEPKPVSVYVASIEITDQGFRAVVTRLPFAQNE